MSAQDLKSFFLSRVDNLKNFNASINANLFFLLSDVARVIQFIHRSCFWSITKKNTSIGVILMSTNSLAVDETDEMISIFQIPKALAAKQKARIWKDFCK